MCGECGECVVGRPPRSPAGRLLAFGCGPLFPAVGCGGRGYALGVLKFAAPPPVGPVSPRGRARRALHRAWPCSRAVCGLRVAPVPPGCGCGRRGAPPPPLGRACARAIPRGAAPRRPSRAVLRAFGALCRGGVGVRARWGLVGPPVGATPLPPGARGAPVVVRAPGPRGAVRSAVFPRRGPAGAVRCLPRGVVEGYPVSVFSVVLVTSGRCPPPPPTTSGPAGAGKRLSCEVVEGSPVSVVSIVLVYNSRCPPPTLTTNTGPTWPPPQPPPSFPSPSAH